MRLAGVPRWLGMSPAIITVAINLLSTEHGRSVRDDESQFVMEMLQMKPITSRRRICTRKDLEVLSSIDPMRGNNSIT